MVKWISAAILTLNPEDSFYERWCEVVGRWEFATLKPTTRDAVQDLQAWEYHKDHDTVSDTLQELYYSKFIMGKIGRSLNISIYDWLKQPRFLCDRDYKLAVKCNNERDAHLQSGLEEEFDDS